MRFRSRGLAWFALLALTTPAWTDDAPPTTKATPTPAPTAPIVLNFHNGSIIKPALLLDSVTMETKLGKLVIPATEIRRIDFGFRLTDEDQTKLDKALRDLGSSRFQTREAATKLLVRMGRLAYPALLASRKGADLEMTKRVEKVIEDIRSRTPAADLRTRRSDLIRTTDSSLTGQITSTMFRVRSELFGEVKVPLAQLREMRSLLPGVEEVVMVDASKYGSNTTWMDTGFEASMGTRLDIKASGEINLDPLNRINNQFCRGVRPGGVPQLTSGEIGQPGQLYGRIGTDGPQFLIGEHYSGFPTREGKLYLRIVTIFHANNIQASGSYQVRISAEPN
jgi:hypothetical protein